MTALESHDSIENTMMSLIENSTFCGRDFLVPGHLALFPCYTVGLRVKILLVSGCAGDIIIWRIVSA